MPHGLTDLITVQTADDIFDAGLEAADDVGLPVTTWETGDPTRSQYWLIAEQIAAYETIVSCLVAGAFLDLAAADATRYDWLVRLAEQQYSYTAGVATYASAAVVLTNGGGGYYDIKAGAVTLKSSTSGATYHNTTAGILTSGPGTTLSLTFEADEAGSASSAAPTEIDTLVTTMLGVTCSNALAAVGTDAEAAASIVANCQDKLATLSHCAPPGAYDYIAKQSAYTGISTITRTRTYGDSTTGVVTQYLATAAGGATAPEIAAVLAAHTRWTVGLCNTPSIATAVPLTIAITYELWVYDSTTLTAAEIEDAISDALILLFAARPIGGDSIGGAAGKFYVSMVTGLVRALFPDDYIDLEVTLPAADVAVASNEVPTLGAITATNIHFEAVPV